MGCRAAPASPSLRPVQGRKLDLDCAAPRPGDCRVQLADFLVRRDEHQHAEPLADETIDSVQHPRQRFAGDFARVGAQQLASILKHQQPPRRLAAALRLAAAEQDMDHVVGLAAEELLGVGDVVQLAPVLADSLLIQVVGLGHASPSLPTITSSQSAPRQRPRRGAPTHQGDLTSMMSSRKRYLSGSWRDCLLLDDSC